ncbi:MAG: AtpZ/AtpI family protein [Planctomycetia bacterium]|nr:AtpZ/AtpI family protein [Planctomycetia bacterium]
MNEPKRDEDPFVAEVRRQAARAGRARRLTFWRGLGLVGSVGWMVSAPAVCGALVGRWLDTAYGMRVFWTLSLLFVGVTLGSASAWRQIKKELGP